MPIVKMPDGTNVRFSDDTPKEQIRAVIDSKFPDYWRTLDAKAGYAEREAARQKEFDANKSIFD
jgi:hypothetical protein